MKNPNVINCTVNDLIMGKMAAEIARNHYAEMSQGKHITQCLSEKIAVGLKAKRKERRQAQKNLNA